MSPAGTKTPPRAPSHAKKRTKPAKATKRAKAAKVTKSAKAQASIDPRIGARRRQVTKRVGRRRLLVLGSLVLVTGLALGVWFLVHSSLLSARVVQVTGATHTPAAAVVAASGLSNHPPMIDVDPSAVAARVERLAWVDTATVSRHWPDGIEIVVTERRPVAVIAPASAPTTGTPTTGTPTSTPSTLAPAGASTPAQQASNTGWVEVDASGRVLDVAATQPPGLVQLVVPGVPGAPGSYLSPSGRAAVVVAAALPPAYAAQVTSVKASPDGQVTMTLTSPVTVTLGTTSQLKAKEEDVAALLAHAPLNAGDVIDVSVPDSPTVSGPS